MLLEEYLFWQSWLQKEKKNLRKRILEELKDERAFVWRYIYEEAKVCAIRDRIHGWPVYLEAAALESRSD
jgi:hypothetical protein